MSVTVEAPKFTDLETAELAPASAEIERQPESVIKLLLERVERGYRRGIDDDGHKIGLAFDPGGLAGVVSQAMAQKFEPTGILNCIDGFYGLSAGGLNALYTAAGQLQEGLDCYIDLMPDNQLVSEASWLPPKPPKMALEVVRDALYEGRRVNVEKIAEEKIRVVLGATDLSQPLNRRVMFRSTDNDPNHPELILDQAIAGSHIPVVAGKPITLNGHEYTDATMSWANSIELAKADGCTDVLSLANLPQPEVKPLDNKSSAIDSITGRIGDTYLDRKGPKLPPAYQSPTLKEWIRHPFGSLSQRILDTIAGDTGDYWDIKKYADVLKRKAAIQRMFKDRTFVNEGVNVERLYPPDIPELPNLLTMDKQKLRVGVEAGGLAATQALQAVAVTA